MTDPRFESGAPPSPEVFSFSSTPLWEEHPSQLISDADRELMLNFPSGYYRSTCHRIAGRIPLTFVYGPHLKIALSEISSCFVVRSEHHYNKDERRRLSLRKHIFETNTDEVLEFVIPKESGELLLAELQDYVKVHKLAYDPDQLAHVADQVISHGSWPSAKRFYDFVYSHLGIFDEAYKAPLLFSVFWPLAEPVLRYRDINSDDRWGKYLGFVDLRLYSARSPVALALLVPPRVYRHDPAVTIITGEYGAIFGGPSFSSCTFTMHDPDASGARCAQSAAINALTLLSDRGARLMGGYTLTYLGKHRLPPQGFDGRSADCLFEYTAERSNAFRVHGMTFDELADLLASPKCGTSVSRIRMPWPQSEVRYGSIKPAPLDPEKSKNSFILDSDKLTRRIIQGYISARCPIILFVDSDRWYKNLVPDHFTTSDDPTEKAHAIVIVGFRRSGRREKVAWRAPPPRAIPGEGLGDNAEVTELIVNDPGFGPFLKLNTRVCFQAAYKFNETPIWTNQLHMLCATPAYVLSHAIDCVNALNAAYQHDETVCEYHHWIEYVERERSHEGSTDIRIELVHRDDIIPTFFHTASHPVSVGQRPTSRDELWIANYEALEDAIAYLDNSWFWCIAGYGSAGMTSLWVFDSQKPPHQRWQLSVHWNELGWMLPENAEDQAPDDNYEEQATEGGVEEPRPPRKEPYEHTLQASVLTSCTERPLSNLVAELKSVCEVNLIDLYVLREVDLTDLQKWRPGALQLLEVSEDSGLDPISSALVMANRKNVHVISEWVADRLGHRQGRDSSRGKAMVAALATYFPHVVTRATRTYKLSRDGHSVQMTRRALAREALTNTVCLALELQRQGIMKEAIIEVVAGTTLDECTCQDCETSRQAGIPNIFETSREKKIELLCWELFEVVRAVSDLAQEHQDWSKQWAFAVELEPGTTYVINDTANARLMLETARDGRYVDGNAKLSDHLGINLDIAHAKIIRREADALRGRVATQDVPQSDFASLKDFIVHGHICDTPGMHTRDQALGRWSPIYHRDADDYEYIDLLTKLANEPNHSRRLPFSRAVGLELEGCSRFNWITQSIGAMKYMFELSRNFP